MNREIKYKLYDGEGNHIGFETHEPNEFGVINIWHETLRTDWHGEAKQLVREGFFIPCKTKCEYTGLKDKNGKEIYEGDIIECTGTNDGNHFKGVMKFNIESKCESGFSLGSIGWYQNEIEIIGNMYETPELLPPIQTKG